jgi:thimet oligopeptidase
MIASRNVGSGLSTLQQIFYGYVDMTLHDKYNPNGKKTTTEIIKNLQNEITLYPYVEDTHFQAAFGHLTNYAAGYYGYLWAKVYAEDCFSIFEEKGIMNKQVGVKFKKEILSRGSSKDEMEMIKAFLQREPNDIAFVKSLGLQITE